jgi:hypothetical protein
VSYDYEVRCLIESAVHVAGDGEAVRDAIPNNTAKINGRFVQLECYDGAPWEMTDAGPRQIVLYREAPDD